MPASVIGRTTYHLRIATTITAIPVTASGNKISTATAVNPDSPAVISPGLSLYALGIAALLYQSYTAACIGGAIVAMHIV